MKREIFHICTHSLIWGNTRTTTIALCKTVENLYLIIIYVVVAFLLFHIIVDFYCNYYCICIKIYLLYAAKEVLILRINFVIVIVTTYDMTTDCKKRLSFVTYKNADWTQFIEVTEFDFAQTTIPTNIHTANSIFTNIILMAVKHNIPKGKMHNNCRVLPDHI